MNLSEKLLRVADELSNQRWEDFTLEDSGAIYIALNNLAPISQGQWQKPHLFDEFPAQVIDALEEAGMAEEGEYYRLDRVSIQPDDIHGEWITYFWSKTN